MIVCRWTNINNGLYESWIISTDDDNRGSSVHDSIHTGCFASFI